MQHPEQLEDEIYMGNASLGDICKSSWTTSRLGELRLDISGRECDTKNTPASLKPWFIKISEVQNRIDNERATNHSWSQSIINSLQQMIDNRCISFR